MSGLNRRAMAQHLQMLKSNDDVGVTVVANTTLSRVVELLEENREVKLPSSFAQGDIDFKPLNLKRKEVEVNWIHFNYPANLNVVACLHGWEAICVDPDCANCERNDKSEPDVKSR